VHGNAEAMRYWSTPPWPDAAPATALLERDPAEFGRGEAIRWAIRRAGDPVLIGTATLFRFSAQNLRAETGYILGRAHWGHGYMGEAMDAILDYAFGPMGLSRIEADTDPRNAASIRMLERLGFVREGLLRQRWIVGDEVCDSVLLGLLKGERRRP
jgi:RimJ/RimL family protein N-acetyltransferase